MQGTFSIMENIIQYIQKLKMGYLLLNDTHNNCTRCDESLVLFQDHIADDMYQRDRTKMTFSLT